MKGIAISCIGTEDVLQKEIYEIIGKKAKVEKAVCSFDCEISEVAKLAYLSQVAEKVGLLIKEGKILDDPYVIDETGLDLSMLGSSFSIGASVVTEKAFKSNDIVINLSEKIKEKTGKTFTYKGAESRIYVYVIDEKYYMFLEFTDREHSKRDYKVFVNKASLRATIAYACSRIAEVKPTEVILDPFCRSGEIPIEIIHYFTGKSIHYYTKDKFSLKSLNYEGKLDEFDSIKEGEYEVNAIDSNMANVKAAEKNSKIAGINKIIKFSRVPTEDLDLKFDKVVDNIVTQLPALGQESENRILKTYRDFFEVSKKILTKKGKITCIGINIAKAEEIAKHCGYMVMHKREIMQGKECLKLFVFSQKQKK